MRERSDGLVIFVLLRKHKAEKILCIGIVWIELGDFLKILDCSVRVAQGFFEKAQVEPNARILRIALG